MEIPQPSAADLLTELETDAEGARWAFLVMRIGNLAHRIYAHAADPLREIWRLLSEGGEPVCIVRICVVGPCPNIPGNSLYAPSIRRLGEYEALADLDERTEIEFLEFAAEIRREITEKLGGVEVQSQ